MPHAICQRSQVYAGRRLFRRHPTPVGPQMIDLLKAMRAIECDSRAPISLSRIIMVNIQNYCLCTNIMQQAQCLAKKGLAQPLATLLLIDKEPPHHPICIDQAYLYLGNRRFPCSHRQLPILARMLNLSNVFTFLRCWFPSHVEPAILSNKASFAENLMCHRTMADPRLLTSAGLRTRRPECVGKHEVLAK